MKQKEEIKQHVLALAQAAYDKKGIDIGVMDMESISLLADYFVLVSASNTKHAQSIADEMEDKGAELGITVLHREGYPTYCAVFTEQLSPFRRCLVHFSGWSRCCRTRRRSRG